jgi:hypothetical protein
MAAIAIDEGAISAAFRLGGCELKMAPMIQRKSDMPHAPKPSAHLRPIFSMPRKMKHEVATILTMP